MRTPSVMSRQLHTDSVSISSRQVVNRRLPVSSMSHVGEGAHHLSQISKSMFSEVAMTPSTGNQFMETPLAGLSAETPQMGGETHVNQPPALSRAVRRNSNTTRSSMDVEETSMTATTYSHSHHVNSTISRRSLASSMVMQTPVATPPPTAMNSTTGEDRNHQIFSLIMQRTPVMEETKGGETKSSAELEEESVLLAQRLLAEEQASVMRQLQHATIQASMASDGVEEDSDLAFALRLQRQETEENFGTPLMNADGEGIDPDEMTYEDLLELGERMGNVAEELWRETGGVIVDALPQVSFVDPSSMPTSAGQTSER
jgi:hypothetical protein